MIFTMGTKQSIRIDANNRHELKVRAAIFIIHYLTLLYKWTNRFIGNVVQANGGVNKIKS